MSTDKKTQPSSKGRRFDYSDTPKYLAKLVVFLGAAGMILLIISSNLVTSPILVKLYRSAHPLPAIMLFVMACSALLGLAANLLYLRGGKVNVFGTPVDVPQIVPKKMADYFVKLPLPIIFLVFVGSAIYPLFLILLPNCDPPNVVFLLEEKTQRFAPRDVIPLNPGNAITIKAEFGADTPGGIRCGWFKSGSLTTASEDNLNCRITVFPKNQPGQEMLVLQTDAPVCQTQTVIPLILDVQ